MKIAHINEQNKLLGWYSEDVHNNIPTPNIEVTDEVWQNALNNNHNKVNEDCTTEYFDFRIQEEIENQELNTKLSEAKAYLASTDFKVLPGYDKEPSEVIAKRAEAREFIRANQGVSNGL